MTKNPNTAAIHSSVAATARRRLPMRPATVPMRGRRIMELKKSMESIRPIWPGVRPKPAR